MVVKFRCMPVQKSDKGEVILDLYESSYSLVDLLKILSSKVNIDLIKDINLYMYMLNDRVIKGEDFTSPMMVNSDTLTIFPMIDGG